MILVCVCLSKKPVLALSNLNKSFKSMSFASDIAFLIKSQYGCNMYQNI